MIRRSENSQAKNFQKAKEAISEPLLFSAITSRSSELMVFSVVIDFLGWLSLMSVALIRKTMAPPDDRQTAEGMSLSTYLCLLTEVLTAKLI